MPYFRVTYSGYVEGEYDDQEAAIEEFLEGLNEDYIDQYGRNRRAMICVEIYNEKEEKWE